MERLSEDIIIDIISRLSIKCVLRCRSVSKSWEATLSTPLFAKTHFDRASALSPITNYFITYFHYPAENHLYFVEDDDIEDKEFEDHETSITLPHSKEEKKTIQLSNVKPLNFSFLDTCFTEESEAIFLGACSGFVCFSTRECNWGGGACPTNPIYLFNPITGEHALLPQFEETRITDCVCGFGFDASRQEYKVVLVYFFGLRKLVQVHTVGSDHWRRNDNVPEILTDVVQTSLPLFFSGSLHWIVRNAISDSGRYGPKRDYILSFQMDNEEFGFVPMPEPLQQVVNSDFHYSIQYALQFLGGCLSIVHMTAKRTVDVWVMGNYNVKESWIKQSSIQVNCFFTPYINPLGFRKNGELVLYWGAEGMLSMLSYNIDSCKIKIYKLGGEIPRHKQAHPFPFVGSFISLKSTYGEKLTEDKVIGTSAFGNPLQKQRWKMEFKEI